VENAMLKVRFE